MSQIKRFYHPMTEKYHDYVEGYEVVSIYTKGVWYTITAEEFDNLVQYGIIELLTSEILIEKEGV